MASKLKLNEVVLQSPNGLVEKTLTLGDDGVVMVNAQIATSNLSALELSFLDGVTSAIQTQLNAKAPLASPALVTPTVTGSGRVISNDTAAGTSVFEIWSGTQAQYDAIGTKDANTLYFIG